MPEGSRTNLLPRSEDSNTAGWADLPKAPHLQHTLHMGSAFIISWYWKEWAPMPQKWWQRLLRIEPFDFVWISYVLHADRWDGPQLQDVMRVKKCFGLQAEEDRKPGATCIRTEGEDA